MITKYQKPVLTFSDAWPWVLGTLIQLGLLAAVVATYWSAGWEALPRVGSLILGMTVFVWCVLVGRHFLDRWLRVTNWNDLPQVGYGIAFVSETRTPTEDEQLIEDGRLVNRIQDAANFWIWAANIHGKQPYTAQGVVFRALEGVTITMVDEPIRTQYGLAGGTQSGQDVRVVGPPKVGVGTFAAYVQHELAHVLLTALGVPAGVGGENHHKIMEAAGFAEEMQRIAKGEA